MLAHDAVEKLARAFNDPQVALVSGNLAVRNRGDSLWTSLQAIKYLVSITVGRAFHDVLGAVSCFSGAFSMLRKNIYEAIGGNNSGPGEDFELTMRLRKLVCKVRFVSDAFASVEAPASFDGLVRQRLRWDRDVLNIRMNQYHSLHLLPCREGMSDTLHVLDFIIFELIPTLVFPFYLLYVVVALGELEVPYLMTVYSLVFVIYVVGIALSALRSRHQIGVFELTVMPIFPLYQGSS